MTNKVDGFQPYNINEDEPSLLPNLREINESPESKTKCLEILRRELQNLQDIEHCLEDTFLMRFLRVSKFNTTKASERVLKYYQHQEKVLNTFRKISLPHYKAPGKYMFVSPYRLKNNSALLFVLAGNVDYSKITFVERFYFDILAINGTLENTPLNQVTGITAIFDYSGFNLLSFRAHTLGWCLMFVETFMNAFPCRIKAVHIVNVSSLFLAVFKIAYPFFPKKLRERVFIHPNDGWKSLHAEIPPEILPEEHGGKMKLDSFTNLLEDVEKLEDQFLKIFKYGYIKTKTNRQSLRVICRKT